MTDSRDQKWVRKGRATFAWDNARKEFWLLPTVYYYHGRHVRGVAFGWLAWAVLVGRIRGEMCPAKRNLGEHDGSPCAACGIKDGTP